MKKVKEQDWQKIEQDIPITNADKGGTAGDVTDFIWEAEWQYNTNTPSIKPTLTPRGFHPAHQQVELVGAMTNRSAYAYAKELIQSWRI